MASHFTLGACLFSALAWGSVATQAATSFNYVLGTQAIYGPNWDAYGFTSDDALTENAAGIADMGGNQFKLRLAHNSCAGYRIVDCEGAVSLKTLSQVPAFHHAFQRPSFRWYQVWLYSFASIQTPIGAWSDEASEREYQEVKEWAVHMLETYSGTGKVFMAGNWEGDWMLMYASGNCKLPSGKWNMTCELRQKAIDNMISWGRSRQRAVEDARKEATYHDVDLFYYIEYNHGPQALEGRPGVTNSVIPHVNPDLVSFSSYSSTNAFNTEPSNVPAVYDRFAAVMDHVNSIIPPKELPSLEALGFQHRLFIGEFGAGAKQNMATATRFTSRVCHAALKWGVPLALYWEFYYNAGAAPTVAIIPPSGKKTPLWHLFNNYFRQARGYVNAYAQGHGGSTPSAAEFSAWGARYFAPSEAGTCQLHQNTTFDSEGYEAPATSAEDCWAHCDENPVCAVGVFDANSVCHVKYSAGRSLPGSGSLACVKAVATEEEVMEEVWV